MPFVGRTVFAEVDVAGDVSMVKFVNRSGSRRTFRAGSETRIVYGNTTAGVVVNGVVDSVVTDEDGEVWSRQVGY